MDFGVRGAAYATVIANAISTIYLICFICSKKSQFKLTIDSFKPKKIIIKEIIGKGMACFVIQSSAIILMTILNQTVKMLNDPQLMGVIGVVNRILTFVYMPLSGIMYGIIPIIGYNHGACNYLRVRETIKKSILFATGFCSIFEILILIYTNDIKSMFISFKKTY